MSHASDTTTSLLARHPIIDRDGRIRGHEALLRDPYATPEEATATALLAVSGRTPAWIKASRAFLLSFDPVPAVPGTVVFEIEPAVSVDDELVDRLAELRAEGHGIALDDYLPRAETDLLLPFADYVRLDLSLYGLAGISAVLERLRSPRPDALVYNVASPAQYESLLRRGVDLAQGHFFTIPSRLEDRPVPVAGVDRLRSLIALRSQPTFEEVERVVANDPGLTVRLLRFANSAAVSARRRFSTVRDAMMLLGSEQVRQFLLLVLLSQLGEGRPALVFSAILRGRLSEAIARDLQLGDPDTAFTAGVLSVVDALLDRKLVDVLATLPVTEELRWAVVAHSGPVGVALDLAIRLERGRAGDDGDRFLRLDEIFRWTDQALSGLTA